MKLAPPKSPLRSPSDAGFPDLSYVTYENEGEMLIGAILRFKKQRYVILNERGREVELPANRLHAVPGRLPHDASAAGSDSVQARTAVMQQLSQSTRQQSRLFQIEDLWSVVGETQREYSNRELFEILHGTAPKDADTAKYLVLRFALAADRVHFKRERDGFSPRSASTVEELKRAELVRAQKLEKQGHFLRWARERLAKPSTQLPDDLLETIELLEEVAAEAPHLDNAKHKEAKEVVDQCAEVLGLDLSGNREHRAFRLLERLSWFTESTNLPLIRHRPPRRFSREALDEAERVRVPERNDEYPDVAAGQRLDLTAAPTFTVDDITTGDMDDALSIEQVPEGYRLGVHISDVASFVEPNSSIDRAARLRATSIYLPDKNIPMLPEVLSDDKLSLKLNATRPALSCVVTFSPSFKVLKAEVRSTLIRSKKRYTYDEFESLLEQGDGELAFLYQLGTTLEDERVERGAQKVYKRDLIIDVADDGSFTLREFDEHGPARALVGEMMVFANSLFARYALDHKLPVVYRRQDPPEPLLHDREKIAPSGPAADYAERAKMKKSSTSTEPGPHYGLGLDAYLQATSPIRRYIDLINQRQLVHHLRTRKPLYAREEVEEAIFATEQALSTALTVSKETRRFWLLRYLKQRAAKSAAGTIITGTVLRTDLKNPLVELDEVFFPTFVKCSPMPKVGDRLQLKIAAVEPQQDYIRLEPIGPRI